jgi:hypothetical protein
MSTFLTLLPLDLKIEIGKLDHNEKFKRVKEELISVTRHVYRKYCNENYSVTDKFFIRPVYVKSFFQRRYHYGAFIWGLCGDQEKVTENSFSVAGSNFKVIKEYIRKNKIV